MDTKKNRLPASLSGTNKWLTRGVFSSGGARGGAFPGAYMALDKSGLLDSMEYFFGSSAGSHFATFAAIRAPGSLLYEVFLNTDFSTLMGEKTYSFWNSYEPGHCFLTRDGIPLLYKIRETINRSMQQFFASLGPETFSDKPALFELYKKFTTPGTMPCLTFRELNDLHQAFPEKFKKLGMLALQHPNCEYFILNNMYTPDIDIALACRASSAIPGVLAPVVIEYNNQKISLIDGGYAEFIPTECFEPGGNSKPEETLIICYADHPDLKQSSAWKAIHGKESKIFDPPFMETMVRDYASRFFGGINDSSKNTVRWNENLERVRKYYADNTVILGIGEIRPHEYQKTLLLGRTMSALGFLDTLWHINKHIQIKQWDNYFTEFNAVFRRIYHALVNGSRQSLKTDPFCKQLRQQRLATSLSEPDNSYHLIRESARDAMDSSICFALTRAVEYLEDLISAEKLLLELCHRSENPDLYKVSDTDFSILGLKTQQKPIIDEKELITILENSIDEKDYSITSNRVLHHLLNIKKFQNEFKTMKQDSLSEKSELSAGAV